MSTLVLELRQGDLMVVNGAPIRFRNRARIELTAKARFLFGKQLMTPETASTPARRIYFALQTAYIGDDVIDIPVMQACQLGIAVNDAHPLARRTADYVTQLDGGAGAVREVCDLLLQANQALDQAQGASI